MNNPDWRDVDGTVILQIPDEMPYREVLEIVRMVSDVTKCEGGYESAFTCGGDILFFHLTDCESD